MWPPIVLPTPFRHSRNHSVSHTRKMTSLFNTIRASIYGARRLCLHVYPLLNETDRLCCTFYSHLSSDGGTFSISVGRFGPQWVLYPVWRSLISTVSPVAHFVPFAIFVCSASMFIIIVLLVDLIFFKPSSSNTRLAWSSVFFFEIGILSLPGWNWRLYVSRASSGWVCFCIYGNNEYLSSTLLVLGVYLTTSDAQTADVECFSTNSSTLLTDQMSDCQ